ncbi:RNA methyltransferase [Thermodesulfovibrio sp. 3907-1M]|uniref:RNA methyltransferase n=1 Tax=Thermodesulfovibrio autotrophicus TaxID=3118333 RepID=A0AAU8GYV6_9BACT
MKWIQSPENPLIKEIKKIIKKPEEKIFIEGINLIEAALTSDYVQIEEVLVTEDFIEKQREFFKTFKSKILVTGISERIAKTISETVTPQGIFAVAKFKYKNLNEIKNPKLAVIADRIQDPGNLGTIIRASEALGAEALLTTPGTCNPLSGKVLRASAGSIFFIPVIKASVKDIKDFILKNKLKLVITDLKAKLHCFNVDFTGSLAVAFGNESHGVSEELKTIKHISCRIPHKGKTESLNVAIAATVLLYEILRQRSLKPP